MRGDERRGEKIKRERDMEGEREWKAGAKRKREIEIEREREMMGGRNTENSEYLEFCLDVDVL